MNTEIPSNILKAIQASGSHLFRHRVMASDYNAEQNLRGRTHFADPETRRCFKSRILDSYHSHGGLVFWLVESNRSKPYEPEKNKRFVAFDIFGTQVFENDSWHKTSAQALKEGKAFLESFDAVTHTEQALRDKACKQAETAQLVFNCLNEEAAK